MSGYNGYPVVFGASKTWESLSGVYSYTSNVTNTTIHVTHAEHAGNGLLFSYVKKDGALANIKEIPAFRVTVGGLEGNSKFGYRYLATEDATEETLVYLGNGNISNGNITISIPFINKGIMFNQSDLETFRQLLTK